MLFYNEINELNKNNFIEFNKISNVITLQIYFDVSTTKIINKNKDIFYNIFLMIIYLYCKFNLNYNFGKYFNI